MRQTITAVIIAKNEQDRIVPCLESIKWCDGIVVVDDMSTDDTHQICRRFRAELVAHPSNGDHDTQRNIGSDNSNSDWILQLDADERVSSQLKNDIKKVLKNNSGFSAYKIARRNYFLGKFMQYGGWYEKPVRLFKKGKARYIGHNIHETLRVDGRIGELTSCLDHYAFSSISQYIDRQLYYAGVESNVMYQERGRMELKEIKYHLTIRPLKLFFKLFIKKQGLRDGMRGFLLSILSAWRHFVIWLFYWERYYKEPPLRFSLKSKVEVDIVMPVFGELKTTKKCVENIIGHTKIPFRLIIIDNNSDLDTKTYFDSLRPVLKDNLSIITNTENTGWIKAVNQGIKNSAAGYVCIMNNDIIAREAWLDNMYKVMEQNPKIGLMNPQWEEEEYRRFRYKGDYIETDWCRGFCILVKRELMERIGYFDEKFGFGYWEDHDYSVRAINAGYICARSLNSFVEHIKNKTIKKRMEKDEWDALFEKNKKIFEKKWGASRRIILTVTKKIFKDKFLLEKIFSQAIEFARGQHKVYIFSTIYNLDIPKHTNIKLVRCFPVFFGLDIKIRIFFNKKRKSAKRYNELYIGKKRIELC